MWVEIEVYAQDANNLRYVKGVGYNKLWLTKKMVNTDELLEAYASPWRHPDADADLWIVPYRDRSAYPILTTRKMVAKLMKSAQLVKL